MGKSFKQAFKSESQKDILDLTLEEKDSRITNVISVTSAKNDVNADFTKDKRQTFIIHESYFEKLKDYVHTRKISGEYSYSQKDALHEAFDLLFKTMDIIHRPESVIQKEKHRSNVLKSSRSPR